MTPVIRITVDATLDDLSLSDYRDIYDEIRLRHPVTGAYVVSLDKFVTMVSSAYSKAQWSKYHNGETTLTRTMRSELRVAVGLAPLPPTVAEATAAASPDAAVWQVGEGVPDHVIMVTAAHPITLHVNGAVSVADSAPQMPRNSGYKGQGGKVAPRRYYARPTATEAQEARRLALGVKWQAIIETGLTAMESEVKK